MKRIFLAIIVVAGLSLSSCSVSGPYTSPTALVTTNSVGDKMGVAERRVWFGLHFGHTDLSITKAAKNGNITKVASVDSEVRSGFFNVTYKTIVTGE